MTIVAVGEVPVVAAMDGAAEQLTFTDTPEALRARLTKFEAAGATGIIFGTSGCDVERELHAFARLVDLRPR